MRRSYRLAVACYALWASACTNDFGAFAFEGDGSVRPSANDASSAGTDGDGAVTESSGGNAAGSSGDQAGQGGSGGDTAGTSGGAGTASGEGGGAGDGGSGGSSGAGAGGTTQDASLPEEDAAVVMPDAGPDPAVTCEARWESTALPENACSGCACSECAAPVAACLDGGSDTDRAHCAAVLACAIQNDCRDWTCYCTSPSCGAPGDSGNGPCAAVMDAAAGGTRTQVMSIREAGDAQQPLVRAMLAVACVVGLDSRSPGGPLLGQCDDVCP